YCSASRVFAWHILFFAPRGLAPTQVKGTVLITQYDHYDPEQENPVPLHTFVFEPDAWDVHGAEGTLGYCYNVFVPYVNRHKDSVWCGLKVEFVAENGMVVAWETTRVMLPSKSTTTTQLSELSHHQPRNTRIQPAGHATSLESRPVARDLDSVTIPLPKR
ncbi:MAG: hypothetical protein KDA85_22860, partial [Planctomycetaceae bacterium]|nr:hypothetical protein [Planctomycetaceae bacterium]